ncbi:MAG: UxaA family hydrolase [Synergistaceae bacterium]|nr:UxaA family hydrolase [Synergistaceae bacterium]
MSLFSRDTEFMGFRRDGRRPGARNSLWIIPTSERARCELLPIRAAYHKPYWIDGIEVLPPIRRGEGEDAPAALQDLAVNPNAAGALFVSARGEETDSWILTERIKSWEDGRWAHVRSIVIDDGPGELEESLFTTLDNLAADASRTRLGFGASNLRVGIAMDEELSGAAVGTVVDFFSDWLASVGGDVLVRGLGVGAASACWYLAACGAQTILLVCRRETSFPSIVPVVAISGDAAPNGGAPGWADFAQAEPLPDIRLKERSLHLAELVLRVASGERTAYERKTSIEGTNEKGR